MARNTTIIRSNYLWDESAAIYEHALQAVGGPGGRPRLPDPVQPARRAQPRAHPAGRPRQRAPGRRQPAQRDRRRVARPRTRSRSSARSSTSPTGHPLPGAGRHLPAARRASPSTTTSPGGSPARADAGRRRPDPGLRGHRLRRRRRPGRRRADHAAATSRAGPGGAVRRRAHLGAGRHGSGSGCRCRATRCRRWCPSCWSRCTRRWSCPTPCTSTSRQAHKGELVMGAGVDAYNGYGQRGAFHVIERQMAAAVELFPVFARAHVLRTWGGIVDVTPGRLADRRAAPRTRTCTSTAAGAPAVSRPPRASAGCWPHTIATRRARTRSTRRSPSTGSSPARSSTSTAPPPWRTERDGADRCCSSPARGAGPATRPSSTTAARPTSPTRRTRPRSRTSEWARVRLLPRQPQGPVRRAVEPHGRLPPLVQRRPRHRHLPLRARLPPRRAASR